MESLDRMRDAMVRYFAAEKQESLLFMVIGAAAIVASVVLFMTASSYRGMSYPLVVIALIQLGDAGARSLRGASGGHVRRRGVGAFRMRSWLW